MITVTGPFIPLNNTNGRAETIFSILKSCLELTHDKGYASAEFPMLSSLVFIRDSDHILLAEPSAAEPFLFRDNASVLLDRYDMNDALGYY